MAPSLDILVGLFVYLQVSFHVSTSLIRYSFSIINSGMHKDGLSTVDNISFFSTIYFQGKRRRQMYKSFIFFPTIRCGKKKIPQRWFHLSTSRAFQKYQDEPLRIFLRLFLEKSPTKIRLFPKIEPYKKSPLSKGHTYTHLTKIQRSSSWYLFSLEKSLNILRSAMFCRTLLKESYFLYFQRVTCFFKQCCLL